MKTQLISFLFLLMTISCSQPTERKTKSKHQIKDASNDADNSGNPDTDSSLDTLKIGNYDLSDRFNLGDNPLQKLTSFGLATVDYKTFENRHVENEIDTCFQITIMADSFEVYKTASENWLIAATINSDLFPTSQGIQIGMTKIQGSRTTANEKGSTKLCSTSRFRDSQLD